MRKYIYIYKLNNYRIYIRIVLRAPQKSKCNYKLYVRYVLCPGGEVAVPIGRIYWRGEHPFWVNIYIYTRSEQRNVDPLECVRVPFWGSKTVDV